ncbi:MAG TPA: aromatic amino acid hydroxylase [Polyangiaceae bacterium]|nr:aromatic amino acid hydroxylase [Polyangiaceae bacterium]
MQNLSHVPHDLRRFVVEQDYAQYNEVDQAVWRFVLLQTYQRLQHTAHPAYRDGLAQTGISVERIPRISEMSECLSRFGWSAVCVDGFIPPRAFQDFQAASILPIAADMRSIEHLTYTPAPDIIHEAAGHAPILPDARYAAYLRAIGEVGKKAFSSPDDARVYAAIFELSEVKETRAAPPELLRRAEERLAAALSQVKAVSEASRVSRLYWWTAEYGLVGTARDYRLYGAGLLSSLWESHSCHAAAVRKLPLSAECVEQAYDITRTQPQLFVARDFEQLFSVLHEVDAALVHRQGGDAALSAALQSEDVATLHFREQRFVTGTLRAVAGAAASGVFTFQGRVGLGERGRLSQVFDASVRGYHLPFGPLSDGRELRELRELGAIGQRVRLRFASGALLEGELASTSRDQGGRLLSARLLDYRLESERAGLCESGAEYLLFVVHELLTAHAGTQDPEFQPANEPLGGSVPKPRTLAARERALLSLYERAIEAFKNHAGSAALPVFRSIHRELAEGFPNEWLLRWNLLECLCKWGERSEVGNTGESGSFERELSQELLALELKFAHREPIASGLRYLGSWLTEDQTDGALSGSPADPGPRAGTD